MQSLYVGTSSFLRTALTNATWFSLTLVALLTTSCVSQHYSNYASEVGRSTARGSPTRSGLVVSADELDDLSSEYFGVVSFTFENRTNDWAAVSDVRVLFPDEETNAQVGVVAGDALSAWAEGTTLRNAVSEYNQALLLGTIGLAGRVAAVASNDRTVKGIGTLAATVSRGALSVTALNAQASSLERAHLGFPQGHLLSGDFTVSPKLARKKFIVLTTSGYPAAKYVDTVYLSYQTRYGAEQIRVKFREKGASRSLWQYVASSAGVEY